MFNRVQIGPVKYIYRMLLKPFLNNSSCMNWSSASSRENSSISQSSRSDSFSPRPTPPSEFGWRRSQRIRYLLEHHWRGYWAVPSWSNDEYLPWLGERFRAICRTASNLLKSDA